MKRLVVLFKNLDCPLTLLRLKDLCNSQYSDEQPFKHLIPLLVIAQYILYCFLYFLQNVENI